MNLTPFSAITFAVQGRLDVFWLIGLIAAVGFLWAFIRLVKHKTRGF